MVGSLTVCFDEGVMGAKDLIWEGKSIALALLHIVAETCK
jgi:hypothetical protein